MEKELNQTTEIAAVEAKQEKQEDKVNIAEIRQKIETRYNDKLTKAQAEFNSQLEAINKELEFYKTDLPKLQVAFVKNGGNKEYFNDWLEINKNKMNFEDLDRSIQESFEVNKWAKANVNFNVTNTLNQNAGENRRLDLEEFEPGTVYKKLR